MTILITGGSGFIGSNFVLGWLSKYEQKIVNVDNLTYAADTTNLCEITDHERYKFEKVDICDPETLNKIFLLYKPKAVIHMAAESHVDRSIEFPDAFIKTNVIGTFCLLEEARKYWLTLENSEKESFRFINVSTDEVFGTLGPNDKPFAETNRYLPNSPYSASKASGDHLVRSYYHTYGMPTITTNCSNNYGPFQHSEKFVPTIIGKLLRGEKIPVYGDGLQIRDWLFVDDHCSALERVLRDGTPGQTYNIGGKNEVKNIDLVEKIISILSENVTTVQKSDMENLIVRVKDRLGHDRRYAIDNGKIEHELGWIPSYDFDYGLRKTIAWYANKFERKASQK